ncbi:hypothetical protein MWU59_08885 [Flavobacteriaceae bacterium F08102]|nr:hypothetical protein [Flavobacteriaceae bacterium F08102]
MTKPKHREIKHRHVLLKSFSDFDQIEQLITSLKTYGNTLQLTILGRFDDTHHGTAKNQDWLDSLVLKWKNCSVLPIEVGVVSNPEIGTIFIAGSFADMFLQEINGKKIGSMTTGIYGVLRGLGIDQERVNTYMNALSEGDYVLILRGYHHELISIAETFR